MRLTNQFSVMGREYDLAFGLANTWKRKLENDKYELIENAIDKLGQYEDIDESPERLAKELKALEIIKEMLDGDLTKKLNANSIKIFKDIFDNLPKEKQDLLKEVL